MFFRNKRRLQRAVTVALAMMVIFVANRRMKIDAADAPGVTDKSTPTVYAMDAVAAEEAAEIAEETEETVPEEEQILGLSETQIAVDALILGADRQLEIEEAVKAAEAQIDFEAYYPYYIKVNRIANTVTVYGIDENGEYTVPYKAFVCSAGETTILGTYYTTKGHLWGTLVGGVYAQYSTRIAGPYLFHSVPYYTPDPSDLEYDEYNKLGELASAGCIRLSVEDSKWIYDNCPPGTMVTLYDDPDDPGPLGKPTPRRIDTEDERRGWDPTDPDERNPWNN